MDVARCRGGRRSAIKRMYRSCNRNERGQLRGTREGRFAEAADDSRNRHGRKLHRRYRGTGLFDSSDYVAVSRVRSTSKCN